MTFHHVPTPDGTRLATDYTVGNDELVVFLHGFTGRRSDWGGVSAETCGPRSSLLVDIVGHGDSDCPDRIEPYGMASVVDQLLSLLSNRPVGTVHLVGYSMGGRIALSMAARAPWFFASVVLVSSSPGLAEPAERESRRETDMALADRLEADGIGSFLDDWFAQPLFAPMVDRLGEDGLAAEHERRRMASAHGLANSLRGTGTGSMPPLWSALHAVRSPVLCLTGELDDKYRHIAEEMTARLPDGTHATIPNAGHALVLESPKEISRRCREFHDAVSGRMTP